MSRSRPSLRRMAALTILVAWAGALGMLAQRELGQTEASSLTARAALRLAPSEAWFAMMVRFRSRSDELLRMEYRSFLHAMILLPVQIALQGRKVIWRLTGYNAWLKDFFSAWEFIRSARFT